MAGSLGGTLGRSSILPDGLPGRDPLGHRQPAVARRRGTVAAGDGCSGLRGRTSESDTDEAEKCDH